MIKSSNTNSLVSIVIPVYNVEEYLEECIESVIAQTYENLEIFLVNDGSTDRSGTICDNYAKKDSRIQVIHKENGGISDARNKAMEILHGDYVCFLDSDDAIETDYVEKLLNTLINTNSDLVGCRYYSNKPGTTEIVKPAKDEKYNFSCDKIEFMKRVYNNCYLATAWGKIGRRQIYTDLKFPVGLKHEDSFVIREVAFNCNKITWIDEPLYFYRVRKNSIMTSKVDDLFRDDFTWIKNHIDFYIKENIEDLRLEAEKLFCHNTLLNWHHLSSELKKDTKAQYKEYFYHIIRHCGYFPLKSRIKYLIKGWPFLLH